MASGYVCAALGLAAAAALLTTSTTGYAAWQTAHETTAAPSGPALESGPAEVIVTSPGGKPRQVDPQSGVRAVVGDTVSLRMPLTIRTGADPIAVLRVEVPAAGGDAALAKELAANPTTVRVTATDGGPELTPVTGDAAAFTVTPASDGRTYRLEWSTSTRATRDGGKPTAANVWGVGPASLQGLSVGARPLTVTLSPGAPVPATPPASTTRPATPPPTRTTSSQGGS